MAKKSEVAKWRRTPKFEVQQHNRCQVMRSFAFLYAPVRAVQNMFPGTCFSRQGSGCEKVKLVSLLTKGGKG